MDRRHFLQLAGAAAAASSSAVAQPTQSFALGRTGAGLTMPVAIGGRRFRGVFDCGCSQSIIDSDFAAGLNIKAVADLKVQTVYGGRDGGLTPPLDIEVGDGTFHTRLIVTSLKAIGDGTVFLAGRDLLGQACLDLDPVTGRATFRAPSPPPRLQPVTLSEGQRGSLVVNIDLDGYEAQASLDSGSNTALMISRTWSDASGFARSHIPVPWIGGDIAGVHPITMTTVRQAIFGPVTFGAVPTEISQTHLAYPVNLGLPILERLRSYWDLPDGKLWLGGTAAAITAAFPHERSGLAFERRGAVLYVLFAAPDSPADENGLRAGDTITAIDGAPVATLSDEDIDAWKHDPSRTVVTLTLGSGATKRLMLRDYF